MTFDWLSLSECHGSAVATRTPFANAGSRCHNNNSLKTYPDSIGITHYLISRLNDYPEDELLPFWPQFWCVDVLVKALHTRLNTYLHAVYPPPVSTTSHLLLSRATESTALEDFILRKSRQSTHLAMLSLWFLQAALSDLAATPTTSAFATCRRVLNGVQAIIFSDLIAPTQSLSSSSSSSPVASLLGIKPKNKLKPHAKAAVVGLGVLASGLALPQLAQVSGEMVLAQGRRQIDPEYDAVLQRGGPVAGPSRQSSDEEDTVDFAPPAGRRSIAIQNGSERSSVSGRRPPPSRAQTTGLGSDHTNAGPPVSRSATAAARFSSTSVPKARFSADGPKRKALTPVSFTNTPSTSALDRTSSSNASAVAIQRRATASASSLPLPQSQSISVPSLPLKDQSTSGHHHIDVHRALATLPRDALSQLLRAHSCRAQLDLLSSLQDISTRLVNVPKAARVSALRAELTVLNHGLPRGCCVGVLCSHEKADEAHHRVVRISPSESVVLNSADRAPYLIHVEVLEGDLDFDPMRRQNIEDVRHVLQEREEAIAKASSRDMHFAPPSPSNSSQKRTGAASKSTTAGSVAAQTGKAIAQATKGLRIQVMERTSLASADVGELRTPPPAALSSPSVHSSASPFGFDDGDDEPRSAAEEAQRESALREEEGDIGTAAGPSKSQQRTSTEPEEPPEEMDMVEQLYGDTSLIPEPTSLDAPVLHNRSLDEEAWSRLDSDLSAAANSNSAVAPSSPETPAQAHLDRPSTPIGGSNGARKPITLDEYADRMRMAAIMLSQLSAQEADAALLSTASAGMVVGLAGAGLEAVKGRLPFTGSRPPPSSAGQGSTGLPAKMDIDAAASGLSAVQGTAPLSPPTGAATSASATPPQSATAAVPPKSKVLSPAAASAIRERIMNEMQALEEERMSRMRLDSKARASGWTTGHAPPSSSSVDDPNLVLSLASKEDPSGVVLSESWSEKKARIRASSPYGHLERWNVFSVIVKTGTDLRQEQLATQLIREFERIWTASGCPHWIR